MAEAPAPLIWIDLEMSGLEPETCRVLEIAALVTDGDLNLIAEGPDLVIHQSDEVLAAMDAWNTKHHGESGLTERVRNSDIEVAEAEELTLQFLRNHTSAGSSPLCGNSIWRDRRFLSRYMPVLDEYLHYRLIDVSTVKELFRRWRTDVQPPEKSGSHRALDDIRESVDELRFYRRALFRDAEG